MMEFPISDKILTCYECGGLTPKLYYSRYCFTCMVEPVDLDNKQHVFRLTQIFQGSTTSWTSSSAPVFSAKETMVTEIDLQYSIAQHLSELIAWLKHVFPNSLIIGLGRYPSESKFRVYYVKKPDLTDAYQAAAYIFEKKKLEQQVETLQNPIFELPKVDDTVDMMTPHPATRCTNQNCWCQASTWYRDKEGMV